MKLLLARCKHPFYHILELPRARRTCMDMLKSIISLLIHYSILIVFMYEREDDISRLIKGLEIAGLK